MSVRKSTVIARTVWPTLLALSVACGGGPTTPTPRPQSSMPPPAAVPPPAPAPPTPGGEGAVAGTWIGTFDTSDPADCHTNTPATAIFEQEGSRVVGTLTAVGACGLEGVRFNGVFQEHRLEGDLTKGDFTGRATGTLSDGQLELKVSDLWSASLSAQIPAGEMHLHRP